VSEGRALELGQLMVIGSLSTPEERRAGLVAMYGATEVEAAAKVMDWARAWVENETCIPEVPVDRLAQSERHGLAFLDMARAWGLL